jgi:hypothetical protein
MMPNATTGSISVPAITTTRLGSGGTQLSPISCWMGRQLAMERLFLEWSPLQATTKLKLRRVKTSNFTIWQFLNCLHIFCHWVSKPVGTNICFMLDRQYGIDSLTLSASLQEKGARMEAKGKFHVFHTISEK